MYYVSIWFILVSFLSADENSFVPSPIDRFPPSFLSAGHDSPVTGIELIVLQTQSLHGTASLSQGCSFLLFQGFPESINGTSFQS